MILGQFQRKKIPCTDYVPYKGMVEELCNKLFNSPDDSTFALVDDGIHFHKHNQAPVAEFFFYYFSTKTYVMGTQKNRLDETVLLSTQNMFKLMNKKIIITLHFFFCLTGSMSTTY